MLKLLLTMLVGMGATLLIARAHAEDPTGSDDPLEICAQADKIYYWNSELKFECNRNYIHIFSKASAVQPMANTGQIRLGSFNLFHLGDGLAPMKRIALVAKIMNQWDIVAAQELMPIPGRWAEVNRAVYNTIAASDFDHRSAPAGWRSFEPGYLQVLNELRKLDGSWSLVLQPNPDSPRTEMSGFYYRSSRARVKTLSYCQKEGKLRNIACSLKIPDRQRRLMSRNAFAAYFQAGAFDFIALTMHVRFRPTESDEELKLQTDEICANFTGQSECKLTKDKISRFYEVKAIGDQIPKLLKIDPDVIFMGDYNLEITRKNADFWNASLKAAPGLKVFQENKTSLSVPHQNLASNYDHFILDPKVTRNCDVDGIAAYDFTRAGAPGSDPILRELSGMQTEGDWQGFISLEREKVRNLVRSEERGGRRALIPITQNEVNELLGNCEQSMGRMRQSTFSAYMELVSDHIPIALVCNSGS